MHSEQYAFFFLSLAAFQQQEMNSLFIIFLLLKLPI
jgi:hypothetical protein